MGILSRFWPWNKIETLESAFLSVDQERRNLLLEVIKQGNELVELRHDKSCLVKSQERLISDVQKLEEIKQRWGVLVVDGDLKVKELDDQLVRLSSTVVILSDENDALKAKLSRKGIKHKVKV